MDAEQIAICTAQVSTKLRLSQLWYVLSHHPPLKNTRWASFIYSSYWLFTQWNWWRPVGKCHIDMESWTNCTLNVNLMICSQNWCDKLRPRIRTSWIYVRPQPLAIKLLSGQLLVAPVVDGEGMSVAGAVWPSALSDAGRLMSIVLFSAFRNHSCIALHGLCRM